MNPFTDMTYAAAITRIATVFGEREALVWRSERYSFADVKVHADTASARLYGLGCRPGDTISLWLANRPEFLWIWLGASQAGLITVMVNTRLSAEEAAYQFAQSDSRVVVVAGQDDRRDHLGDLAGLTPVVDGGAPGGRLHMLQHVIVCDPPDRPAAGVHLWANLPAAEPSVEVRATDPNSTAVIVYSSGTTALPKGAMLTHAVWRKAFDHGERFRQSADDRLYLCVPLYSILANVNGVLTFWSRGSAVVLDDRFEPRRTLATIAQERCTAAYLLPLMIERLLADDAFADADLSSLRTGIVLSSDPEHHRLAIERLGMPELVTSFGMTETSSAVSRTWWSDPVDHKVATHGRPLPDIEVRIVDPETGCPLPADHQGEIQVRGYCVMKGYYRKPDETARAFTSDGWYRTGDAGTLRADGILVFHHRLGDSYKHKGYNVSTAEVEAALTALPCVREAAVVPMPAGSAGETGCAFIVAADGAVPSEDEILGALKRTLAGFKLPGRVLIVDALPRTATGKVQKHRLRDRAVAASRSAIP